MTRLVRNLLVTGIAVMTSQAAWAEDLFSEIAIGSVFANSSPRQNESVSKSGTGRRLSGPTSLRTTLSEAGFRPQGLENDEVLVVVEAPNTKGGVLNVTVAVNPAKAQIVISAPLVTIVEAKATLQGLLRLMDSSRANGGIYFTAADQTVIVRRTLDNDDVTAGWLKSRIQELVDYANAHAASWQALGESKPNLAQEKREDEPLAQQGFSMTGQWSAEGTNGESYGFQFEGNRFKLAIVANGQVHRSEGTWSLQGDRLILAGKVTNLSGVIATPSPDRLVLEFNNQKPLSFKHQ